MQPCPLDWTIRWTPRRAVPQRRQREAYGILAFTMPTTDQPLAASQAKPIGIGPGSPG